MTFQPKFAVALHHTNSLLGCPTSFPAVFFALLSARPPLAQGLRSQPGDGLGYIFEVLSDIQKSVPRSIYFVDVISNFASANFSK